MVLSLPASRHQKGRGPRENGSYPGSRRADVSVLPMSRRPEAARARAEERYRWQGRTRADTENSAIMINEYGMPYQKPKCCASLSQIPSRCRQESAAVDPTRWHRYRSRSCRVSKGRAQRLAAVVELARSRKLGDAAWRASLWEIPNLCRQESLPKRTPRCGSAIWSDP